MDIAQLRKDTPGTQYHKHLNNAGASLPPSPVVEAVQQYLEEEYLHGGYEIAAARQDEINGFYPSCANLLNTSPRMSFLPVVPQKPTTKHCHPYPSSQVMSF